MTPRVAVVIVSYNTRALTLEAVASVVASTGVDLDVWVVDNASSDGSADAVRSRFPQVRLVTSEVNVGFGRGNNLALARVDAPWVLLMNSDARFADPGGLRRLVSVLEADPGAGVVGPRLEDPDGHVELSARAFPSAVSEVVRGTGLHRLLPTAWKARRLAWEFRDHSVAGPADWLTGACLLVRGRVLREVGGFDPAIFLYGEELEWCWRVGRAGWGIRLEPGVRVIHRRGASGASAERWRTRLAMAGDAYAVRKHRGWAYFLVFFLARFVGLTTTTLLQGLMGTLSRDPTRRLRGVQAGKALAAWISVVAEGGARRPDGVAVKR